MTKIFILAQKFFVICQKNKLPGGAAALSDLPVCTLILAYETNIYLWKIYMAMVMEWKEE